MDTFCRNGSIFRTELPSLIFDLPDMENQESGGPQLFDLSFHLMENHSDIMRLTEGMGDFDILMTMEILI